MSVSAYAAKLEWDYVREHGCRRETARDPWCITRWARAGALSGPQAEAANRLATVIAKSNPGGFSVDYQRVDSSSVRQDWARKQALMLAGKVVTNASAFVLRHFDRDGQRQLVVRVFEHPHPSVADLCAFTGTRDVKRLVRIAAKACDLLAIHWRLCDKDVTAWNERARSSGFVIDQGGEKKAANLS